MDYFSIVNSVIINIQVVIITHFSESSNNMYVLENKTKKNIEDSCQPKSFFQGN